MAKFVCSICGYVYEGEKAPEQCPVCKAPASKFIEQAGEMTWAAEHVVGVAQGAPEDIIDGLRKNFTGECTEVGMYLAMARVAYREGYPEIGEYWVKAGLEEDGRTLVLIFQDGGMPYDPLAAKDPDTSLSAMDRPFGGLGILLVKKLMDEKTYAYTNGQNILTLKKRL